MKCNIINPCDDKTFSYNWKTGKRCTVPICIVPERHTQNDNDHGEMWL